ncbi:MAG: hypothetical protein KY455_11220, partial [Euryarchaeota archaeon]|nr:hypothetical protein [Euryarchaeota archaeon]
GYGIGRALSGRGSWFGVVPWFLAAVLLHSAFNFLATLGAFFGLIGVIPLIILAIWGFTQVRKQIFALSLVPPDPVWHRVGDKRDLPTWERVERPKWRPGEERPPPARSSAPPERTRTGEPRERRPSHAPSWSEK